MKNFRLSLLLIGLYFIGWFILVFCIYSLFHTESRATSEVVRFYERSYFSSVIFMILIPLVSLVLSVLYKLRRNPVKHWNYLIFTMFSFIVLVVGVLFDFISVSIYKLVYFFDWIL